MRYNSMTLRLLDGVVEESVIGSIRSKPVPFRPESGPETEPDRNPNSCNIPTTEVQRARPAQQSSGSAEWTEVCSEGDATNPVVFLPPLSSPILYIINPRFNYTRGYSLPYNLYTIPTFRTGTVLFDGGTTNRTGSKPDIPVARIRPNRIDRTDR